MALSAETEAILERLKAEGQLTRNSGTNSIRSVKIQLDRFEGIFNTISANVAEQTSLMRKSMSIQEEAIEAQKRKDDLDEIKQEAIKPTTGTDTTKPTQDDKEKSKGIFDFLAGVGGSMMGALKPLLIGGAGLFVAYNFAKGYIDEKTGGGFTAFENSMIDTFNNVDWTALGESFVSFASKVPEALTAIVDFVSDPLNAILAGAGLTAAGILSGMGGGALARGVTRGIIDGVLGRDGSAGGRRGGGGRSLLNLRNVARGGALGILTGALAYYGDDVKNWLQQQGMPENWANVAVDSAVTIGTFTSIGMMFGPQGALVGAAIGLAYTLGKGIYNWFVEAEEEGKRKLAERMAAVDVIEGKFPELGAGGSTYDEVGTRIPNLNTSGALGSVSVNNLTNSTEEEKTAVAARIYGEQFKEALTTAAEGAADDPATLEAAQTVQRMLSELAIQDLLDSWGPAMTTLRGQLPMVGDGLGLAEGDEKFTQYFQLLQELDALTTFSGGNRQLTSMRDQLRVMLKDQFQGLTTDDADFSALTPEQQRILRQIELMESQGGTFNPTRAGGFLTPESISALESAAGGQTIMTIGKMGGDTFVTNQTTRMGDQNVANVQQVQTTGGDSNPMSLAR